MREFESTIQMLKYNVLKETAKGAFEGTLARDVLEIPKRIRPGKKAAMRCCIYKERAIVQERVKLAMGGHKNNPNIIEVIDIACDECPRGGYNVTDDCRGCLAHYCKDVCKRDAISFDDNMKALIEKSKCIECGLCSKVCPYSAITNYKRPCEKSCFPKAISMGKDEEAYIDNDKCTACGACINKCPFGAIMDKSFILDVISLIKEKSVKQYDLYALIAPAIAGQFNYAKYGQIVSGIKKLGFDDVFEAALGADMTAYEEAQELAEKGFLTSSCCPAFVSFIEKQYPDMSKDISHNLSPSAMLAKYIKSKNPNVRIVFIGPCTAKKAEFQKENVKQYVDFALTFEELQALLDARDIDISLIEYSDENNLKDGSYFGRIFARSGGLAEAVKEVIKERKIKDFDFKPITCSGLEECNSALLRHSKNLLNENFIEGMACIGGCVGGAGSIRKSDKNRNAVDLHADSASKNITENINQSRI